MKNYRPSCVPPSPIRKNIEDGLNSLEQYRQRRTREVKYGEYPPKQIAIDAGSIAHKRLCTSEAVFGPWDL